MKESLIMLGMHCALPKGALWQSLVRGGSPKIIDFVDQEEEEQVAFYDLLSSL